MNILKQRTNKDSIKMYAVQYMEQVGSFTYTRTVIKQLQGSPPPQGRARWLFF